MEGKESFGKYILKKRKEAGLSQKVLADRLFVTESAVSKWERGISYPDITLVASLCEILNISEHELITATDDHRQKETERQAERFRRLVRGYSWVFYALYGISLLVCFICNIAVFHTLSWFFIVLTAEMTAFSLTNVPVLCKKQKGLMTLLCFFVSLNLLLLTCNIYTGGDWFVLAFIALLFAFSVVFLPLVLRAVRLPGAPGRQKALICFAIDTVLLFALVLLGCLRTGRSMEYIFKTAFPVAAFALVLPWLFLLVIRYIRCGAFFKTSVCLAAAGIYTFFCNSVLNVLIDKIPFQMPRLHLTNWNLDAINENVMYLILFTCILASLLFAAGGIASALKRKG